MSTQRQSTLEKFENWPIEYHIHVFACWAAGNAGRLPILGPKVSNARRWLEIAGFNERFFIPNISCTDEIDRLHRKWRRAVIDAAGADGYALSHGRAAKFINVYNKARFLRPEIADRTPFCLLHPPIDSLIIANLKRELSGTCLVEFKRLTRTPWSRMDSAQYEELIKALRYWMSGLPFWKLEALWPGAR